MATSAVRHAPRLSAMLRAAPAAADRPNAHPSPPWCRAAACCCIVRRGTPNAPIARQRPTAARARCVDAQLLPESLACEARTRGPVSALLRRIERQCAHARAGAAAHARAARAVGADLRSTTAPAAAAPPPGRSNSRKPQARRARCSGRTSERRQPSCATRHKHTSQQGQQCVIVLGMGGSAACWAAGCVHRVI